MGSVGTDLKQAFGESTAHKASRVCWFQKLTDAQRDLVRRAAEAGYTRKQVTEGVNGWGYGVGLSSVQNHLSGRCNCDK